MVWIHSCHPLRQVTCSHSLSCYLIHSWGEKILIYTVHRTICLKTNLTNLTGIWTRLADVSFQVVKHYTTGSKRSSAIKIIESLRTVLHGWLVRDIQGFGMTVVHHQTWLYTTTRNPISPCNLNANWEEKICSYTIPKSNFTYMKRQI